MVRFQVKSLYYLNKRLRYLPSEQRIFAEKNRYFGVFNPLNPPYQGGMRLSYIIIKPTLTKIIVVL